MRTKSGACHPTSMHGTAATKNTLRTAPKGEPCSPASCGASRNILPLRWAARGPHGGAKQRPAGREFCRVDQFCTGRTDDFLGKTPQKGIWMDWGSLDEIGAKGLALELDQGNKSNNQKTITKGISVGLGIPKRLASTRTLATSLNDTRGGWRGASHPNSCCVYRVDRQRLGATNLPKTKKNHFNF